MFTYDIGLLFLCPPTVKIDRISCDKITTGASIDSRVDSCVFVFFLFFSDNFFN